MMTTDATVTGLDLPGIVDLLANGPGGATHPEARGFLGDLLDLGWAHKVDFAGYDDARTDWELQNRFREALGYGRLSWEDLKRVKSHR